MQEEAGSATIGVSPVAGDSLARVIREAASEIPRVVYSAILSRQKAMAARQTYRVRTIDHFSHATSWLTAVYLELFRLAFNYNLRLNTGRGLDSIFSYSMHREAVNVNSTKYSSAQVATGRHLACSMRGGRPCSSYSSYSCVATAAADSGMP